MKAHTNDFKNAIKEFGREIDSKITYELNGSTIELGKEDLNSIEAHYESNILKSVMKQLDVDSNVDIPIGTVINYQFGLNINGTYEYIDYGNYIVYSSEKQEDTNSWKIICYDKMLYSMKPYESLGVNYPITIINYINALCNKIGLTFANANNDFVNSEKEIQNELYLDSEGNSLDYTYRDVLDELAGATASTICINDNDELEIRYINVTPGKNILAPRKQISTQNPRNGITWSYDEETQTYTFDGTCDTDNTVFLLNDNSIDFISGKTKSIVYWQSGTISSYCRIRHFNSDYTIGSTYDISTLSSSNNKILNLSEQTFTCSSGGTSIRFDNGSVADNFKIKIMVTNDEDTEYQEYGYGDIIDEEYLKDINVNFGEKFGRVNSVVFSRSAESDNIYQRDEESIEQNGLCEIKIKDNQILNGNNRDEFLSEIYDKLHGIEYYINDFSSTGIIFYDLLDQYSVKIGENLYKCIMFNNEVDITQGLEEQVHTDMPEESQTDYTKADKTDRRINQTYLIVDKQNQQISSVIQNISQQMETLGTSVTQTIDNITANVTTIQEALDNGVNLVKTTSVTIDDSGLNVSTSTSKISTIMTNNSFEILDSGNNPIAFFGYDETDNTQKSQMDNLTVTNYLVAGNHRIEKYKTNRTGVFYIGG